jgi:phenylpropionate dioxygenase-like ring-hydroxylating dioxygenase large terminal subunit
LRIAFLCVANKATMLKLNGYWYIAAANRELGPNPICRLVEAEPLVLFRDSRGNPHALIDRCAHRGMALSCGRVVGDCIECPYHGWQYDGDGKLCAVPALCDGEKLPQPKTMIHYPVVESDEHIWVWIGQESPSGPPFHFPKCGEAGWTTFFLETKFEAPVEACLENFLDVPHTLFVHPGLFRGNAARQTRARIRRFHTSVEAEFLDEQPLEGFGPRLLFPRDTVLRHTDRFILPAISRVDYAFGEEYAFIITSQCTQRAEYLIDVTTAITWKLPLPAWLIRPFLRWYCRRVIQQDVGVLKILGDQSRQFGVTCLSTTADLLGTHIRGLRRQAAEGHLPSPKDSGVSETSEIFEETILRI